MNLSELSVDEFRDIVEAAVEKKFMEWIGDPDTGLELKEEVHTRLARQMKKVADGERGISWEEAIKQIELE